MQWWCQEGQLECMHGTVCNAWGLKVVPRVSHSWLLEVSADQGEVELLESVGLRVCASNCWFVDVDMSESGKNVVVADAKVAMGVASESKAAEEVNGQAGVEVGGKLGA